MPASKVKRLAEFAYVCFLFAWSGGFLIWLGMRFLHGQLLYYADPAGFHFVDFVSFYRCGQMALLSPHAAIYDPAVQQTAYNRIISPLHVGPGLYAPYVPWMFLLMAPLACLPLQWAYLLWNCACTVFAIWSLHLLIGRLRHHNRSCFAPGSWLYILAVFASWPVLDSLADGQTTLLLVGALALACKALLDGNEIACGLWLSVLSLKPHYLLYLLIPVVAKRKWKVVVACVAAVFALLTVGIAAFGFDNILSYPRYLMRTEEADVIFSTWYISIRGPLTLLLGRSPGLIISTLMYLAAMPWLFIRSKNSADERTACSLALAICCMLVLSPHLHIYDLASLAITAVLVLATCNSQRDASAQRYFNWCKNTLILFPLIGAVLFVVTDLFPVRAALPFIFLPLDLFLLVCCALL